MEKFYSIKEVALMMKVSKAQIYKWINSRRLKGIRLGGPGSDIRFKESDIKKFVSNGEPAIKSASGKK